MGKRSWNFLVVITCAVPAAFAGELDGVWRFEKEINTRANGQQVSIAGPQYDGVLIYTADGHVSATVMPRGREWNVGNATQAQLHASVGEGSSTAYAGRYVLDRTRHTVTHLPLVSVDPADEGAHLERRYQLIGDRLLLSGTWNYQGEELTFTVYWIRAGAADK